MQQQQGSGTTALAPNGAHDRAFERFAFAGSEVFLFTHWNQIEGARPTERFVLQLKDISAGGLCGLTDAPLEIGDLVFVQFDETLIPAAQVVWFRRALVGLSLTEPLPEARMQRLYERHQAGQLWSPAMRARSDLPGWWTDIYEHARGRKAIASRG